MWFVPPNWDQLSMNSLCNMCRKWVIYSYWSQTGRTTCIEVLLLFNADFFFWGAGWMCTSMITCWREIFRHQLRLSWMKAKFHLIQLVCSILPLYSGGYSKCSYAVDGLTINILLWYLQLLMHLVVFCLNGGQSSGISSLPVPMRSIQKSQPPILRWKHFSAILGPLQWWAMVLQLSVCHICPLLNSISLMFF